MYCSIRQCLFVWSTTDRGAHKKVSRHVGGIGSKGGGLPLWGVFHLVLLKILTIYLRSGTVVVHAAMSTENHAAQKIAACPSSVDKTRQPSSCSPNPASLCKELPANLKLAHSRQTCDKTKLHRILFRGWSVILARVITRWLIAVATTVVNYGS